MAYEIVTKFMCENCGEPVSRPGVTCSFCGEKNVGVPDEEADWDLLNQNWVRWDKPDE